MSNITRWKQHFPYETPRDQQTEAINAILSAFDSGKRFFALEAGTGVGKSAVAATVAKVLSEQKIPEEFVPGALFVTTQKLLQDQYERDYQNHGMRSIKSARNYKCSYKKFNTCADGQTEIRLQEKGSAYWNTCTFNCNYKNAKQEFLDAGLSVTNFPYLLTEAHFNGKIKPHQFLVIDEAHNVATELSKFIEIAVSEKFTKQTLKIDMPIVTTHHQALAWITDVYYPKLYSYVQHVHQMLEKYTNIKEHLEQFVSLTRQLHMIEGHHKRLQDFLRVHSKENWVFEVQESDVKGLRKLSFKPIDVAEFAHQYLFRLGYKVLFMSATLIQIDKFLEMVGVNQEDAEKLSLPSPFPVKNRPILFVPIGRMTSKEIDNSLPKLTEAVKQILEAHKNEKGIIHTHSYKIAHFLKRNIKTHRLLISKASNRDKILKKHIKGSKPTVLISPSMTEGVDLDGDASRFQIICKVPYPYLGDKLVKKRMNKWKWWYPFQTSKTVIQSVGRSVRSESDTAVTYILDADWERFYSRNKQLFPNDFHDCLR
jgi:ATP-dependent DNA helicase DinG